MQFIAQYLLTILLSLVFVVNALPVDIPTTTADTGLDYTAATTPTAVETAATATVATAAATTTTATATTDNDDEVTASDVAAYKKLAVDGGMTNDQILAAADAQSKATTSTADNTGVQQKGLFSWLFKAAAKVVKTIVKAVKKKKNHKAAKEGAKQGANQYAATATATPTPK